MRLGIIRARALGALALLLALGACDMPQGRDVEAKDKAQAAYRHCEQLRAAGKYATHVETVDCAAPAVVAAYTAAAYPYQDLVAIGIEARRIAARKLDEGDVTPGEYRRDVAALDQRIADEEKRRHDIAFYGGNPKPVPPETLVAGLPSFTPPPPVSGIPSPRAGCVPIESLRSCN